MAGEREREFRSGGRIRTCKRVKLHPVRCNVRVVRKIKPRHIFLKGGIRSIAILIDKFAYLFKFLAICKKKIEMQNKALKAFFRGEILLQFTDSFVIQIISKMLKM